jgi:hypothetical protein
MYSGEKEWAATDGAGHRPFMSSFRNNVNFNRKKGLKNAIVSGRGLKVLSPKRCEGMVYARLDTWD